MVRINRRRVVVAAQRSIRTFNWKFAKSPLKRLNQQKGGVYEKSCGFVPHAWIFHGVSFFAGQHLRNRYRPGWKTVDPHGG
jgi:hypothetical protein